MVDLFPHSVRNSSTPLMICTQPLARYHLHLRAGTKRKEPRGSRSMQPTGISYLLSCKSTRIHSLHHLLSCMISSLVRLQQLRSTHTKRLSWVVWVQTCGINSLLRTLDGSIIIERTTGGAKGLIDSLRRTFVTYGIPDELASDGGPEFVAGDT